jgi:hypothetical protein
MMENEKDKVLWQIAKDRVEFKRHLMVYVVINIFLWILWYVTSGQMYSGNSVLPWPAWVTLGWGIGVIFNYFSAYQFNKKDSIEREYEKLKNKGL